MTAQIGNITVARGEKKTGFLAVYQTGIEIPVTFIRGQEEGKTMLISSGVHCAEFPAIETAVRLGQELEPSQVKGQIIIVHAMNITGFQKNNSTSLVPEDGMNLNRVFPGCKEGSVSEQIADYVVKELFSRADYYVDMHGGNVQEQLAPYVYYAAGAAQEKAAKAKAMARFVNVSYMVGSPVTSQGAYNCAGSLGIPSILLERGCSGVWNEQEVTEYKADIKNILRGLGILDDGNRALVYNLNHVENVLYLAANSTGLWYPVKKAGERVKQGEVIGQIRSFFGKIQDEYRAEKDGVILYQSCTLSIEKGDEIVAYGTL